MSKLLMSLAMVAALGVSPAALAAAKTTVVLPAPMTSTGTVRLIDAKMCRVTIANMGMFLFGKRCSLSKITVGEWVSITWTKSGNNRAATKIVAAKPLGIKDMWGSHLF